MFTIFRDRVVDLLGENISDWAIFFLVLHLSFPFFSPLFFDKYLRPILMQLDLQSVEKVPFSTFAWTFAPKMLEIGLPRFRMTWSFSKIYPEMFPASPGAQLQEITVSTFSIQLGQTRLQCFFSTRSGIVTQLDRKSADGNFLQLGPWRSGKIG